MEASGAMCPGDWPLCGVRDDTAHPAPAHALADGVGAAFDVVAPDPARVIAADVDAGFYFGAPALAPAVAARI
jgi:hypothetical protein